MSSASTGPVSSAIWTAGDITMRIESGLALGAALDVARSMAPFDG